MKGCATVAGLVVLTMCVGVASAVRQADNPSRINQLKSLKKVDIKAAGTTVHAWIMDTESKRQEGMMFLTTKDVAENQAMIFVFTSTQSKDNGFWMHNCPLGLDIIYIDPHHKVVNVGDGAPQNDKTVPALKDYDFVLEVRRGWAKRHGLKPGALVGIPAYLKTSS